MLLLQTKSDLCYSGFFWPCHVACAILVPRAGMDPLTPQWRRRVLNTGPSGRSLLYFLKEKILSDSPVAFRNVQNAQICRSRWAPPTFLSWGFCSSPSTHPSRGITEGKLHPLCIRDCFLLLEQSSPNLC